MVDFGKRIRQAREKLGLSQAEAGRRLGVTRATINQWEAGTTRPARDRIYSVAEAFGIPVTDFLEAPPMPLHPQTISTVPLQSGSIDFPVYRCNVLPSGEWEVERVIIAMVERPPFLRYSQQAFGIYCHGAQQSPAFEPRDLVLVDPNRPVNVGDDAVFVRGFNITEINVFQGVLRRLVAEADDCWTVRQFNPASDYKLQKVDWPRALFVAGKYSR